MLMMMMATMIGAGGLICVEFDVYHWHRTANLQISAGRGAGCRQWMVPYESANNI